MTGNDIGDLTLSPRARRTRRWAAVIVAIAALSAVAGVGVLAAQSETTQDRIAYLLDRGERRQVAIDSLTAADASNRAQLEKLGVRPAAPAASDIVRGSGLPPVVTVPGPAGPAGASGQTPACVYLPTGCLGATGAAGKPGGPGLPGKPGTPGETGETGNPGLPGGPGNPGGPGLNGSNGTPGEPGKPGGPGQPGADGAPGQPGADGGTGPTGPAGTLPNSFTIDMGGTRYTCTDDPATVAADYMCAAVPVPVP